MSETEGPFERGANVVYGAAERLSSLVRRVTARNPSPMTFTGTRTYLVGAGEVAVIDPGPADPAHLAAVTGALAAGERIGAILVTHSHLDHSPGAAVLSRETGAPTFGFGPHGAGMSPMMRELAVSGADLGGGEGADRAFVPQRRLVDGETIESAARGAGGAPQWALTALHTPGHLSNHLCFSLEAEGAVFTGDHVMGWATTMVSPPEGDMASFMRSLDVLRTRAQDRIYHPGHGGAVTDPQRLLGHLLRHRRQREAQILRALIGGPADAAALTNAIYVDVDPALHGAAARNVFAHLLGLAGDGRARALDPLSPGARFALT